MQLVIVHDEYNGKVSAKVKFINSGAAAVKTMDPNRAKAFAIKMQQRIKAFDAKNGTPAPAAKPANGAKPPAHYGRQPGDDGFDDPNFP